MNISDIPTVGRLYTNAQRQSAFKHAKIVALSILVTAFAAVNVSPAVSTWAGGGGGGCRWPGPQCDHRYPIAAHDEVGSTATPSHDGPTCGDAPGMCSAP